MARRTASTTLPNSEKAFCRLVLSVAQARPLDESAEVQSIERYEHGETIPNEELGRHIGKVGDVWEILKMESRVGHRRRCALFIPRRPASTLFVRS